MPAPDPSSRARFHVDGMCIDTDLELEGWPRSSGPADWRLEARAGALSSDDAGLRWTGEVSDGGLAWAYYARHGARVRVHLHGLLALEADPAARTATLDFGESDAAPPYALRRALPYLAAIGGRTVLHAACVVLDGDAVLCCAAAQTGKSTLALALDRVGVPVLADDHVALDVSESDGIVAHASVRFADAGHETRHRLRPETARAAGKQSVPYRTPLPDVCLPVRALCFLTRGPDVGAKRLGARDVVARLLGDVLFVGDPDARVEHARRLDAAAHLANTVPTREVTVPEGLDRMVEALDGIRRALTGSAHPDQGAVT